MHYSHTKAGNSELTLCAAAAISTSGAGRAIDFAASNNLSSFCPGLSWLFLACGRSLFTKNAC